MAAVIPIGTRPVRRARGHAGGFRWRDETGVERVAYPGDRVSWQDGAETRTGTIGDDTDPTGDLHTDLLLGPPGAPTQHLVPVIPDVTRYVDVTAIRFL